MGRVSAPFGVKGWVKVQPYTETVASLLNYENWWLRGKSGWEDYRIAEREVHGASLVARFEGISDRNAAATLKGREVAVLRSDLPAIAPDQYYWADLVGMEVENQSGECLGRIKRLIETGANAVLVVNGKQEQLLPCIQSVVRRVDLAAGKVFVDWERGS